MKVLILKPSSLGDIIHALPVLRLIKRQRPNWVVHWWIAKHFAPLLEMDPDIAALHYFDRNAWSDAQGLYRSFESIGQMRSEEFDVVIDLQGLVRSALHGWAARGAYRIGLQQNREGAALFYDEHVERPTSDTHAVDWCRAVLPRLGLEGEGQFEWIPKRPWLNERLTGQGFVPGQRWVILCPGARWSSKQWPVEYFEQLMRELADGSVKFAVVGGGAEKALGQRLAGREDCVDLTGKTTLPELTEWLRAGSVVVSNDSGPMHVAAAVGTPVIALFGPTSASKTGPYNALGTVLTADSLECAACARGVSYRAEGHNCMRSISPDTVAAAVAACE